MAGFYNPASIYTDGSSDARVDGLDNALELALIQFQAAARQAGFDIRVGSGRRTVAEQTALFNASDKSGKMVGTPTGSKHVKGQAADLRYNGKSLGSKGTEAATQWAHANAGRFGLTFPMSYEAWHIEHTSARNGKATTGSSMNLTTDQLVEALAREESGNKNIPTAAKGSSASGYFQITDDTWNGYKGYRRAIDAPRSVQKERATQLIGGYLKKYGGNVDHALAAYYVGPKSAAQLQKLIDGNVNPTAGTQTANKRMQKFLADVKGQIDKSAWGTVKTMAGAGVTAGGIAASSVDPLTTALAGGPQLQQIPQLDMNQISALAAAITSQQPQWTDTSAATQQYAGTRVQQLQQQIAALDKQYGAAIPQAESYGQDYASTLANIRSQAIQQSSDSMSRFGGATGAALVAAQQMDAGLGAGAAAMGYPTPAPNSTAALAQSGAAGSAGLTTLGTGIQNQLSGDLASLGPLMVNATKSDLLATLLKQQGAAQSSAYGDIADFQKALLAQQTSAKDTYAAGAQQRLLAALGFGVDLQQANNSVINTNNQTALSAANFDLEQQQTASLAAYRQQQQANSDRSYALTLAKWQAEMNKQQSLTPKQQTAAAKALTNYEQQTKLGQSDPTSPLAIFMQHPAVQNGMVTVKDANGKETQVELMKLLAVDPQGNTRTPQQIGEALAAASFYGLSRNDAYDAMKAWADGTAAATGRLSTADLKPAGVTSVQNQASAAAAARAKDLLKAVTSVYDELSLWSDPILRGQTSDAAQKLHVGTSGGGMTPYFPSAIQQQPQAKAGSNAWVLPALQTYLTGTAALNPVGQGVGQLLKLLG